MTIETMRSTGRSRPVAVAALAPALLALQSLAAHAGPCPAPNQKLLQLPEFKADRMTGVLKGTILLVGEQRRLIFRAPGTKPGQPGIDCQPQRVRAFIGVEAQPKVPPPPPGGSVDPYPGPLLRARLGDIVQLTFVNQIDPNRFGASIDMGEKRFLTQFIPSAGCDISNPGDPRAGYPLAGGDAWPDCFHGSSTGNIHFHGTHTNPDSTGDNVLVEVRPSPRDAAGKPQITPENANASFRDFFKACEAKLRADTLSPYPQTWTEDTPLGPYTKNGTWLFNQTALIKAYDAKMKQDLWTSNQTAITNNQWPQYYIGAYPYCFRLPEYKDDNWPPPSGIKMGQAPGTHWYHAHKHGSTAINVANGMTGVFIIEGDYDDKLRDFYGANFKERVMVINQLGVSPNVMRLPSPKGGPGPGAQDKGPDFSVNGRAQPLIDMQPGEVQMWRIANTSGRSGAFFNPFPTGFIVMPIAQDGVQFQYDTAVDRSKRTTFLMASGNRVDLLVQAPTIIGKYNILVQHAVDPQDLSSAIPVTLVQVNVSGPPPAGNLGTMIPKDRFPKQPKFLTNITESEITGSNVNGQMVGTIANPRVIQFGTTGPNFPAQSGQTYGMHTINGSKFEDGTGQPVEINLNAVEQWQIENYTFGPPISHPFHIHINPFQITEIFDPNQMVTDPKTKVTMPKYVFDGSALINKDLQCAVNVQDKTTWQDCHNDDSDSVPRVWWDVFPIPSGASPTVSGTTYNIPGHFRMRSRFVDFAGQYVIHCHILAHEDRGMMAMVVVSSPQKKLDAKIYKHH